jgi:hypothetical protein
MVRLLNSDRPPDTMEAPHARPASRTRVTSRHDPRPLRIADRAAERTRGMAGARPRSRADRRPADRADAARVRRAAGGTSAGVAAVPIPVDGERCPVRAAGGASACAHTRLRYGVGAGHPANRRTSAGLGTAVLGAARVWSAARRAPTGARHEDASRDRATDR